MTKCLLFIFNRCEKHIHFKALAKVVVETLHFANLVIVAFAVYLKMKQNKVQIPPPGESRNSTVGHRKKHKFILWHAKHCWVLSCLTC